MHQVLFPFYSIGASTFGIYFTVLALSTFILPPIIELRTNVWERFTYEGKLLFFTMVQVFLIQLWWATEGTYRHILTVLLFLLYILATTETRKSDSLEASLILASSSLWIRFWAPWTLLVTFLKCDNGNMMWSLWTESKYNEELIKAFVISTALVLIYETVQRIFSTLEVMDIPRAMVSFAIWCWVVFAFPWAIYYLEIHLISDQTVAFISCAGFIGVLLVLKMNVKTAFWAMVVAVTSIKHNEWRLLFVAPLTELQYAIIYFLDIYIRLLKETATNWYSIGGGEITIIDQQ